MSESEIGIDPLTLPFDQYQRYTAAAQVAAGLRDYLGRPRLTVLDVGGFFRTRRGKDIRPAALFLPADRVFAVDLAVASLPCYALARGEALPFGRRAFDLVIACDTLEHVPPARRPAFVDELLRVASHAVLLIAPFDSPATRLAERVVYEYLIAQGYQQVQLKEHLDNGLPQVQDLRALLTERGLPFLDFADGYLPHWLLMMLIKHTPGQSLDFHLDLDRYYNLTLSPGDRREPAYRRGFVIVRPEHQALLTDLTVRLQPAASPPDSTAWGFLTGLFSLLNQGQMAATVRAQHETARQQAEMQERLAALQAENARLREQIAAYEQGRFIRSMRRLAAWRARLGLP